MKTSNVVFHGLPAHSVIQNFIDPEDKKKVRIHIRRWDREFVKGWKTPYTLTAKNREGREIGKVEIPAAMNPSKIVDVTFDEDVGQLEKMNGNIPMNFFQTSGHKFSEKVDYTSVINNLHEINNMLQYNFNYRCLNDQEALNEIESSKDEKLIKAYNDLRSPSYKADLLRYFLLWKYGGVYCDDKSLIRHPLDTDVWREIMNNSDCDGIVIATKESFIPEIAFL